MTNPWNYVAGALLAIALSLANIQAALGILGIQKGIGIVSILFIFACVIQLEEHVITYEKNNSPDTSEQQEAVLDG